MSSSPPESPRDSKTIEQPSHSKDSNTSLASLDDTSQSIQDKLRYFSSRLAELGLESIGEVPSRDVKLQDPPLATSKILDKLPEATHKVVDEMEKEQLKQDTNEKIKIKFQPIGSAPVLNQSVCKISSNQKFSIILAFLKRKLKMKSVFCYVNNSFVPNPHQIVGELWEQFKVNDILIISYCATVAFG